ncbi:MAG: hypothetical protein WCJ95_09640 [Mariniphaga sp.]
MKILTKLWAFITQLFKKIDSETKILAPITIQVVQAVKEFMNSPADNVLVFIADFALKGIVDPFTIRKVNDTIKEWLPKVLTELTLVNSIANLTDPNDQLKAIFANLKLSSDETKAIVYRGLAALVLEKLKDGKLTLAEAGEIAEYYYQDIVLAKAA